MLNKVYIHIFMGIKLGVRHGILHRALYFSVVLRTVIRCWNGSYMMLKSEEYIFHYNGTNWENLH